MPPSAKCASCGKFTSSTGGACCSKCSKCYHLPCVAIPENAKVVPGWICPVCTMNQPRNNHPDTPIRSVTSCYTTSTAATVKNKAVCDKKIRDVEKRPEQPTNEPDPDLALELRELRKDIRCMREEFKDLRRDMTEFTCAVTATNQRLDIIDKRMDDFESRMKELTTSKSELEAMVEKLKIEANNREQELFCNDVEITNIPEEKLENPIQLVSLIANKLGVALKPDDVVSATRIGVRRTPQNENSRNPSTAEPDSLRPRPIAVRLSRRAVRDDIIRNARVRRVLTTSDMGLLEQRDRRFFINERLTNNIII